MESRKRKRIHTELLEQVKRILAEEWHPIEAPVPPDEYDRYARTLTSMLFRECTLAELVNYLAESEAYLLSGTSMNIGRRARVAATLKRLVLKTRATDSGGS